MRILPFIVLCGFIVLAIYSLQGKESDAQKLDRILTEAQRMPDYQEPVRYKTKQAQALADLWQISDDEVTKPVDLWHRH